MLIIKILLLLTTLFPTDGQWQRINTPQQISFLFPGPAEILKKTTGGITSNIYQAKDLVCVFGVVCSDFSAKGLEMDHETVLQVYEQMKKGSVEMETAILKGEKTVPYENMIIKEIEYSIIKDNFEMTYFKRFIFRDNFVYQVSIGGKTRHMDYINKEKEIFFNSINFK